MVGERGLDLSGSVRGRETLAAVGWGRGGGGEHYRRARAIFRCYAGYGHRFAARKGWLACCSQSVFVSRKPQDSLLSALTQTMCFTAPKIR